MRIKLAFASEAHQEWTPSSTEYPTLHALILSPKRNEDTSKHFPALDGVRGIAILLVMFHHLWPPGSLGHGIIGRVADRAAESGWLGVDLFFVLSGFLITGILVQSRGSPHYFRNFYMRRTLRIFPLYFGCIAVTSIIQCFSPESRHEFSAIALSLWTYTGNYQITATNSWILSTPLFEYNHFWSLCVEEQFYLFWPTLIFFVRNKWILLLSTVFVVGAAASKMWLWRVGHGPLGGYVFTFSRMDSLAVGALAFYIQRRKSLLVPLGIAAFFGAMLLVVAAISHKISSTALPFQLFGFPAVAFVSAQLIVFAYSRRASRVLSNQVLRWFGTYSYGQYVFHILLRPLAYRAIGQRFDAHLPSTPLPATLLLIGSLCLSYLSYHAYEKRFLRLKKFF